MAKRERSIEEALRYMDPKQIAASFKSKRERAAIAAVFRWLGLNGIVAWEFKRRGVYTTIAMSKRVRNRLWKPHQAVVVPVEQYERAFRLLGDNR